MNNSSHLSVLIRSEARCTPGALVRRSCHLLVGEKAITAAGCDYLKLAGEQVFQVGQVRAVDEEIGASVSGPQGF